MPTDWFATGLNHLKSQPNCTEADVTAHLIRPALRKVLKFDPTEIFEQKWGKPAPKKHFYLDLMCKTKDAQNASVIVEVKNLGIDLMGKNKKSSKSAPVAQLYAYLKGHPLSGDGTWGIATNGEEWVLMPREGDSIPTKVFPLRKAQSLVELKEILKGIKRPPPTNRDPNNSPWLPWIIESEKSSDFVAQFNYDLTIHETLFGDISWAQLGAAVGPVRKNKSGTGFLSNLYIACLRLNFPNGQLTPHDIAEELETTIGTRNCAGIIGVAFSDTSQSGKRHCRGFVWKDGKVVATALIDPELPGSRAWHQFRKLDGYATDLLLDKAFDVLSSTPLHKQFHENISEWFKNLPHHHNNDLRHLIRVLFARLLQERGFLPEDALWGWTEPKEEYQVHGHITWLFEEVLAKPKKDRTIPSEPWRKILAEDVPFLNGSLFSPFKKEEKPFRITNDQYLGKNGLLTILDRYDWTLSDQTSIASENAIDPSMLGELFERMILVTQGPLVGDEKKMPAGTYYTPQDVADEMVSDALGSWLHSRVEDISLSDLRALAHPSPQNSFWKTWSNDRKKILRSLLSNVTALDPCSGSGVFTMSMLFGLSRTIRRLGGKKPLQEIIAEQLNSVDINPIAVFITRLRLFIALVEDRTESPNTVAPLPNLETRCITADTLSMNLKIQQILGGEEWDEGINRLRKAREKWTRASHPKTKKSAANAERRAREHLILVGEDLAKHESELEWLYWDFLSASATAAKHDIKELFPAPEGGWDIVIGNPPYQRPDTAEKNQGKKLGYLGSGDLYLMFIEAAVSATRSNGCVVLIVPHSVVFRTNNKAFRQVRSSIQSQFKEINIRTFDNSPQPVFPRLPWLKGKGANTNRQRVTILNLNDKYNNNIYISGGGGEVSSQGLIRLNSTNRSAAIRSVSKGQAQPILPPVDGKEMWTQAPTPELALLLEHMHSCEPRSTDPSQSRTISFPRTAMYFLTSLPTNHAPSDYLKSKGVMQIQDDEYFWPWLGLFNSHLFHAWWLMVGDAFHVLQWQYQHITMPAAWKSNDDLRLKIQEKAIDLVSPEVLKSCFLKPWGTAGPNYNFHLVGSKGPAIINELDKLLLDSYGLPHDPLMHQMRTIRAGSAHELS